MSGLWEVIQALLVFGIIAFLAAAYGYHEGSKRHQRPPKSLDHSPVIDHLAKVHPFVELPNGEHVTCDWQVNLRHVSDGRQIDFRWLLIGTDEEAVVPAGGSFGVGEEA